MSNHARKLDAHRARRQRHENARAQKRREAKAYSKQTPRSERRSNTVQFPMWATSVFQSSRKKVA